MDMHNSVRSLVATGNERRGRPGPQPTASNMKQMVIIIGSGIVDLFA